MTIGAVIRAGQDVTDRAGIAQLHGMTWRQARRAQPWAAPGHPNPITTDRPTHGRPQLWDLAQATAFANGQPIPALPQGAQPLDLLDRFAAAEAAGVNPATWASDTYDGRVPEPDKAIHGGSWWYRQTVENYREQRAYPQQPSQQLGRPTGRAEAVPRGQIRAQVAALVAQFDDADQRINIADIARRLGIHYTTALHHVHAITAEQSDESGSTARETTTSPKPL
jgi:hypothetical protein